MPLPDTCNALPLPVEGEVLPEDTLYGWYSPTQAASYDTFVYQTEDRTSTVLVSFVGSKPDPKVGFTDLIYVGRVYSGPGGFVEKVQGSNSFILEPMKRIDYREPMRTYFSDFPLGLKFKDLKLDTNFKKNIITETKPRGDK